MKKLYDNVIEHKYGYCFKKDGNKLGSRKNYLASKDYRESLWRFGVADILSKEALYKGMLQPFMQPHRIGDVFARRVMLPVIGEPGMVRCGTVSHVPIIPPYGAGKEEWEEYIKLPNREFVYVEDSIFPKNVSEESKVVFCNDHAEDFKNETLYKIAESLKVNKPYNIVVTVDKERDVKPIEGVKLTLSKISDMIKEEHDR